MMSLPTLADVAISEPINGMVKWPDPEQIPQDELVRPFLNATGDARRAITDVHARNYVIEVNGQSLIPSLNPRLGSVHFAEWFSHSTPRRELSKQRET